jgi:hypothetical protein
MKAQVKHGASERRGNTSRGKQSGRTRKPRPIPLSRLSERSYAARDRALHVLAAMRRNPNLSLTHAAKLQGVKRETVKKYLSAALSKHRGRFLVTKSDRYTETLYVPDVHGNSIAIKTRSSRDREVLGRYLRDLGRYLRGERNALASWHGKKIAGVELLTAGRAIVAIEPALSEFSLYRSFNGGGAV